MMTSWPQINRKAILIYTRKARNKLHLVPSVRSGKEKRERILENNSFNIIYLF